MYDIRVRHCGGAASCCRCSAGVPDRPGRSVSAHLFRHVGEASGGDEVAADGVRVSRRGIEATRDQYNVRVELPRHRHDHAPVHAKGTEKNCFSP